MELFELKDYQLTFAPQALAISCLKDIWDKYPNDQKDFAVAELAYVYYYTDYSSDFQDILDPKDKAAEIRKNLILPDGWNPDDKTNAAIEWYQDRQRTVISRLYEDTLSAIAQISKFLKSVDLTKEVVIKGTLVPKYDVKKIVDSVEKLPKLSKALDILEQEVRKKMEANATMRGGRDKNIFEDGLNSQI
jgi:hypothetical protein